MQRQDVFLHWVKPDNSLLTVVGWTPIPTRPDPSGLPALGKWFWKVIAFSSKPDQAETHLEASADAQCLKGMLNFGQCLHEDNDPDSRIQFLTRCLERGHKKPDLYSASLPLTRSIFNRQQRWGMPKAMSNVDALQENATVTKKHFDIVEELQNLKILEVNTNELSVTNLAVELKPIAIWH
jgi:hypothetical protein